MSTFSRRFYTNDVGNVEDLNQGHLDPQSKAVPKTHQHEANHPRCNHISHLSSMPVENPKYGGVALVQHVGQNLEAVLHVFPAALDGVHRHVVALQLPGFGELCIQHVEPH